MATQVCKQTFPLPAPTWPGGAGSLTPTLPPAPGCRGEGAIRGCEARLVEEVQHEHGERAEHAGPEAIVGGEFGGAGKLRRVVGSRAVPGAKNVNEKDAERP